MYVLLIYINKNIRSLWTLLLLLFISVSTYFNAWIFYAFITIASYYLVKSNISLLPSFLWFVLTLFPLFILKFYTPTYLYEFSFGFSLFLGIGILGIYKKCIALYQKIRPRYYSILIVTAFLIICGLIGSKGIRNQIMALMNVVESRQNFAAAINYIQDHQNSIDTIVIMEQKIRNNQKKREYKLSDNISKSTLQHTMSYPHMENFLKSMQMNHIQCVTHSNYVKSSVSENKCILLLQNQADIKRATKLGYVSDTIFLYSYSGNDHILICR
jgi:hypothetical protein